MHFNVLGINNENYKICMEKLNGELSPVMTEFIALGRRLIFIDGKFQPCEPTTKNDKLKLKKYQDLYSEFEHSFNDLPRSSTDFNGSVVQYFTDVEAITNFVNTFKKKFEDFRNNFYNPEIPPQFDI